MKMDCLGQTFVWTGVLLGAALADPLTEECKNPKNVLAVCFDTNFNGVLDAESEAPAFFKHLNVPGYQFIDTDRNGVITQLEIEELEAKTGDSVYPDVATFEEEVPRGATGLHPADVDRKWRTNNSQLGDLLLRRESGDVSMSLLAAADVAADVEAALLSFSRDFEESESIWQMRAAVSYPFVKLIGGAGGNDEHANLSAWMIAPTIVADRVSDGVDSSNDVDKLSFSLINEAEISGGFFDVQYFRFSPTYTTDFSFDTDIALLALEWEPLILDAGMGAGVEVGDGNWGTYRWGAKIESEIGQTFDAGGNPKLEEEFFTRLGPSLSFGYSPPTEALKRVGVSFDYRYLLGLVGKPANSKLFEAGISYSLDEAEHYSIELEYRNGDVPIVETDTETLEIGFGVKF